MTPNGTTERGGRRALLVDEGESDAALRTKLAEAGFEAVLTTPSEAVRSVEEQVPSVVLLAFGGRGEEGRLVSLARRLRSAPETFALPVVFLFREDARTLRSAAEHFGADDYISRGATAGELRARLEALLWRAAAGRRAAPVVAEQRSEIDNFIFLLDSVGADARAGEPGAVALVEAEGDGALAAAHGFLKLNLRRVDAVTFYGPATLLVYLPRASTAAAREMLAGLREEFLSARPQTELRAGLAAFPSEGVEVEGLIEKAEAALDAARTREAPARVLVYGEEQALAPARRESARRAPAKATTTAPSSTPARDDAHDAPASEPPARRARTRRLMLVVSDAARMAQVNLLLRSAGYEARAAFDAQHALGLLRIDRPDLLVVDYELQGMDGVEMLRRLGKQSGPRTPPPAVVMLPGGREELRREAFAAGARGAVALPYDPVELLEALEKIGDTE